MKPYLAAAWPVLVGAVAITLGISSFAAAESLSADPLVLSGMAGGRILARQWVDGDSSLWFMDADGSNRELFRDNALEFKWSPDGSRIAYMTIDGPTKLRITALDGSSNEVVMRGQELDGPYSPCICQFEWSPDGRRLAVTVSPRGENKEIWSIRTDGTGLMKLAAGGRQGGSSWSPLWSPRGGKIAFISDRRFSQAKDHQIFVMRSDGSHVRRLTNRLPPALHWLTTGLYDWSAKGGLAFVGGGDVRVMDRDGSNKHTLTDTDDKEINVRFSPDGQMVAFSDYRYDLSEAYVAATDGTSVVRLTENEEEDILEDWSPDGMWLLLVHYGSADGSEIVKVSPDGSDHQQITPLLETWRDPDWQPQG